MIFKKTLAGQVPGIFVDRKTYPLVSVGLLHTAQDKHHEDPVHWASNNYTISQVSNLRKELVNSSFKVQAKEIRSSYTSVAQELSMASKPADVEVDISSSFGTSLAPQGEAIPFGPMAQLQGVRLIDNVSVNKRVEQVVSDTDCKATTGLAELYNAGLQEHTLSTLLSVGNLGTTEKRKIVPTRWSITAVDDTISKQLIAKIQQYPIFPYRVFAGNYLGNYFFIMLFDAPYSYELFEISDDGVSTDHELFGPRSSYATNCVGGYYAARLGIVSTLNKLKKQGAILTLRFITKEYTTPLGVWVVREAVKKAMATKPLEFADKDLMMTYMLHIAKKKFGKDITPFFKSSHVLDMLKNQKLLNSYM